MVVGVSLGLLGGGGSILTVPLLAYVGGLDPKQAVASSLVLVGGTSAVSVIAHVRAGRVRWGVALPFGAAAMAGAVVGGLVARFVPGTVLLIAFAGIMLVAGGAMLRGRQDTNTVDEARHVPKVTMAVLGVAVGTLSGLVGAGGGFLLVPALAVLAGLPMSTAVGTSLVVITMQSFAGLTGHLARAQINCSVTATVTTAAAVGALIGGRSLAQSVRRCCPHCSAGWFLWWRRRSWRRRRPRRSESCPPHSPCSAPARTPPAGGPRSARCGGSSLGCNTPPSRVERTGRIPPRVLLTCTKLREGKTRWWATKTALPQY